ncbi:hybrid sensor histidine kinase/response regulator [Candidatus Contubernalis alkaliaceticus]|uniref:hybrid sensor histidine kinase/response regulator n=1 Tax=Candidatus Contubernalis alkaliaceticus TaxID=338645 RepID=UPI001F4C4A46|nr:ATP-binding protein [Candidatus Contubernalis alkalaceticus]UNC90829.1 response regulator [Candidatus Contubernalis alkalaceticus]
MTDLRNLRKRAEDEVKGKPSVTIKDLSLEEAHKLLHKLQVYQVELEMQNDELCQTQLELDASRTQYFDLFDTAPVGYVTLGAKGLIEEANMTFANLLGVDRSYLTCKPFTNFIFKEDQEVYYFNLKKMYETQKPSVFEVRIIHKNGDRLWVRLEMTVVNSQEGFVCRAVIVDITDLKETEEALREREEKYRVLVEKLQDTDRQKNDFIGLLSHEIRNPLASIMMGLSLLSSVDPCGGKAVQAREIMSRQVVQLSRLIDDLLDVTRINQNKIDLKIKRLELNGLIKRIVEDYMDLFQKKGVNLELELADIQTYVEGDAARLTQMVGNLLHNAVKFTNSGGSAEVVVLKDSVEQSAVIHIVDNGIGLESATLSNIFQPFVQVKEFIKHEDGGLGLGLVLVKGLAELHGGEVSAHSDGLGKGSRFVIRLPLASDQTDGGATEVFQDTLHKISRRVLVIDDISDVAQILKNLLEHEGHQVMVANSGKEGIAKAKMFRPEVVICDIGLPDIDGYQVAKALRAVEEMKGTYLISLSGYAREEDVQRAKEAGFHRQLAKPVELDTLRQTLAQVGMK